MRICKALSLRLGTSDKVYYGKWGRAANVSLRDENADKYKAKEERVKPTEVFTMA
jgi:hypothetical protein